MPLMVQPKRADDGAVSGASRMFDRLVTASVCFEALIRGQRHGKVAGEAHV
jgi:hypothetical protein